MKPILKTAGAWLVLVLVEVVLFSVGGALFATSLSAPTTAEAQSSAMGGLLAMAAIDAAIILALVKTSRLSGWRLMLLVASLLWGIKTFTSQLEAVYFMPNVSGPMLPALLLLTVPLTLGVAPLAVLVGGRLRTARAGEESGWLPLAVPRREAWLKVGLLAAVVYPALFFTAGWFIAFASPEVRAFYGASAGGTFFSHLGGAFTADPLLLPFEALRGALWVLFAVAILRSTRGPWWVPTLWTALWFALVQNDVHLVPNPLMSPEVQRFHFVETASSNALFALCIGWALTHSWARGATSPAPSFPGPAAA